MTAERGEETSGARGGANVLYFCRQLGWSRVRRRLLLIVGRAGWQRRRRRRDALTTVPRNKYRRAAHRLVGWGGGGCEVGTGKEGGGAVSQKGWVTFAPSTGNAEIAAVGLMDRFVGYTVSHVGL